MTSKERVKRAIEFRRPDRVPIYLFNKDIEHSDIVAWTCQPAKDFVPSVPNESEWGFVFERLDNTMGQPKEEVIKTWDSYREFVPPDPLAEGRLDGLDAFIEQFHDKYILCGFSLTGFTILTFLRGFTNTLEDFYLEPQKIEALLDVVMDFETEVFQRLCEKEIDGISFHDDWGTQNALMISPDLWRRVFKPRYKAQFDLIHSYGKHVYFHSCGYIKDIIDDLIEIGADILNFNQPEIYTIDVLGKNYGGRVCFNCPVDLQKVALTASKEEIYDYTGAMIQKLGSFGGGFIGYVEEYSSIGLSEQNYQYCLDALKELG